jgi:hypothetical protein
MAVDFSCGPAEIAHLAAGTLRWKTDLTSSTSFTAALEVD